MTTSLKTAACLFSLLCLLSFAAALSDSAPAAQTPVRTVSAAEPLQTVTIHAPRPVPTIVVSARRLRADEKLAEPTA